MNVLRRAGLLGVALTLVVFLAAVLGAAAAFAQAGKPDVLYYKSWGIVIGIEDYLFAPKLDGNVADAKAVAEALRQLGFEEVIEIYDKKAKSRQIEHIFKDFLPRKVGRQDRLVVFFAGHAGVTKDMDGEDVGYLVPWDVQLNNVGKSLTLRRLKRLTHRIMSKHILFFLDTSVSGWDVTPAQQLSLEGRLSPEDDTEKRAIQLLAAARHGEPVLRQNGQGIFVQTLLAGLEGASDADQNGWILASELGGYVTDQVQTISGGAQHPQFARLDGDGDMILREGGKEPLEHRFEPQNEAERKQAAQALYEQALVDLQEQKPAVDALALLNQALTYDPTLGDAYILKGYVLLDILPDLEAALIAAANGVRFAPDNPDSHFTFGLVLQRRQEYADAERAFLQALKVNPSYADVYLTLGDLYALDLEDKAKSAEAYERYLELGGTANRARDYVDRFRAKKSQGKPQER